MLSVDDVVARKDLARADARGLVPWGREKGRGVSPLAA